MTDHDDINIDKVTGITTTGHDWDGIRELNNPLPRWWLWTFYATIVFAIIYAILYPAIPLVTSATKGVLGYSSRAAVTQSLADAEAGRAAFNEAIRDKPIAEILADDGLREVALAAGGAAFRVNCIQCHGSGAQGSRGYPNLNDDDWLWGGKPEDIVLTLNHGIRYAGDPDTRDSVMPSFLDVLTPEQIRDVSQHVAGLSDATATADPAAPGAVIFAENCAACHGEDAKGNRELGAPNLTDAIWLYGSGEAAIAAQLRQPSLGVMPAWGARLGETTVKQLAIFVHSLGGGE